jgi:heptaprenyl diphosphate synthase
MSSFDLENLLHIPDLGVYISKIDKNIIATLPLENTTISKPVLRIMDSSSKHLRSTLVIAVAIALGAEINDYIINCCTAIELVHIASLIHDDIIDNSKLRWGKPSINGLEGLNTSLIIGDFLFAKAGVVAANLSIDIAKIISFTIAHLCIGESLELRDRYDVNRRFDDYFASLLGKTSSLIIAACKIGAIASGVSSGIEEAFSKYGEYFGLTFQLIDDLSDFLSTTKLIGKPVGNDVQQGIYSLPILHALSGPNGQEVKSILLNYKKSQKSELIEILANSGSIKYTCSIIEKYISQAKKELRHIKSDNPTYTELLSLPKNYQTWFFKHKINQKYLKYVS